MWALSPALPGQGFFCSVPVRDRVGKVSRPAAAPTGESAARLGNKFLKAIHLMELYFRKIFSRFLPFISVGTALSFPSGPRWVNSVRQCTLHPFGS